jgi:hypothetical protein
MATRLRPIRPENERHWSFRVCGGTNLVGDCVEVFAFHTQYRDQWFREAMNEGSLDLFIITALRRMFLRRRYRTEDSSSSSGERAVGLGTARSRDVVLSDGLGEVCR